VKFVLLTCATTAEPWSDEAERLYIKKISPFVSFEVKRLANKKTARQERDLKIRLDSEAILNEIKSEDFVILFDERGESLDSRKFAEKVERILNSGKKRAIFIIGGAYGVDDQVRKRAQLQISLSKMVMNHLLAQTVALEQIYRSFAILRNLPYHND
jgi:23S rRNA (pseudouridine1915-N3)-methyltransferase